MLAGGVASAYDPFHEPLLSDPYPFFARARADAPVFHAAEIDHWVVARYGDVKQVLLDSEAFSASNSIAPVTPLCEEAQRILGEGGWRQAPALGNNDPTTRASGRTSSARSRHGASLGWSRSSAQRSRRGSRRSWLEARPT